MKNKIPTPQQIHTAKFYYCFFNAIPDEKWTQGIMRDRRNDRYCAVGHLRKEKVNGKALSRLFYSFYGEGIMRINDTDKIINRWGVSQEKHAKTNILTALKNILDKAR